MANFILRPVPKNHKARARARENTNMETESARSTFTVCLSGDYRPHLQCCFPLLPATPWRRTVTSVARVALVDMASRCVAGRRGAAMKRRRPARPPPSPLRTCRGRFYEEKDVAIGPHISSHFYFLFFFSGGISFCCVQRASRWLNPRRLRSRGRRCKRDQGDTAPLQVRPV